MKVFKYRQEIVGVIFDTLIENGNSMNENENKNRLRRLYIYCELVRKLGRKISETVCSQHLSNLVEDGFLIKDGKYYILTNKFTQARELGIFGKDGEDEEGTEKRRRLQQSLVLDKCIYKIKSIPEKKLDDLLKYVGAKREHLHKELYVHVNGTNFYEFVFKKISTVRVRLVNLAEYGKRKMRRYYYEEDGFSLTEAIDHFRQPTRNCHLFVGNYNYYDEEIIQNVESLKSLDILRPIQSYDPKQTRFSVGEHKSIQEIRDAIWNIHNLEMYYLLQPNHKLSDDENEGLKALFGRVGSNKLKKSAISNANLLSNTESELLEKGSDVIIDRKIKVFYDKYHKHIQQSYLYSDMVTKLIVRNSHFKPILIASTQKRRKRLLQGIP